MTEASYDTFVDRRTEAQRTGELATQILFWYDEEGRGKSWLNLGRDEKTSSVTMKRRRTNGVAISMDGNLLVARATCSRKDQFCRSSGRHVVEERILNADLAIDRRQRQKTQYEADPESFDPPREDYAWIVHLNEVALEDLPEEAARAYAEMFPEDERGIKRAFNVGNVYVRYKKEIERRANELDLFNG